MIVLNVWNSKNTNLSETGISKAQESLSTTTWHIWKSSSILIFLIFYPTFQKCSGKQENARGDNLITPSPNTWSPQIPGHSKHLFTPNSWSPQIHGHPKKLVTPNTCSPQIAGHPKSSHLVTPSPWVATTSPREHSQAPMKSWLAKFSDSLSLGIGWKQMYISYHCYDADH